MQAIAPHGGPMSGELNRVIDQVSKEKGIDKTIVVSAIEEMMHSAARRTFGQDRNIESRYNSELGEVELFEIKKVVSRAAIRRRELRWKRPPAGTIPRPRPATKF